MTFALCSTVVFVNIIQMINDNFLTVKSVHRGVYLPRLEKSTYQKEDYNLYNSYKFILDIVHLKPDCVVYQRFFDFREFPFFHIKRESITTLRIYKLIRITIFFLAIHKLVKSKNIDRNLLISTLH